MSRDSRNMLVQIDVIWIKKESKLWDKKCTNYPRPNFNLSFNRKNQELPGNFSILQQYRIKEYIFECFHYFLWLIITISVPISRKDSIF